VKHGHLACLQYAHKNGQPWGIGTWKQAMEKHGPRDPGCLQYLRDNKCPGWEEYM